MTVTIQTRRDIRTCVLHVLVDKYVTMLLLALFTLLGLCVCHQQHGGHVHKSERSVVIHATLGLNRHIKKLKTSLESMRDRVNPLDLG